jgi:signal transduction histidine kinase
MSLPERHEVWPWRSLYVWVLLSMVCILALSFLAFRAIGDRMQRMSIDPVYDRFDEMQLESARGIFESSGEKGLRGYLAHLNRIFGGAHYLLNANGTDLITGESRSAMLPAPPAAKSRAGSQGHWIITHRSLDGKYWFAAEGQSRPLRIWTFLPYYLLVIGATVVLCWIAAVGVISPIRRIANTIAAFGQGDLDVRVKTNRKDEVGQLGRSFNETAERLQRLIVSERRLLSDISHELRSPLARLKFATKLARTSADTNAALDRIDRDVDRITSLVADIVEINFVESDAVLHETAMVSVRKIVDELAHDCTVEAQARGCFIEVSGQESIEVRGVPELLRRAIENALRNAIRYAPEKSAIQLAITADSRNAMIAVRDFGPGVPETALARIFDPFFRVEEARNASGGGSGLGLSIAKRAVLLHHGTILAENASPGLRVKITIPLGHAPTAA